MNYPILKSFSVSNFGPFSEKVVFTTQADKSKKEFLQKNTFFERDEFYNKVSYVFGANGAGKSSLCRAFFEMKNIINFSPIFATNSSKLFEMMPIKDDLSSNNNYFKFDKSYDKVPTTYSLEIILDNTTYNYSFSVLKDEIVQESLTKKYKRTEPLLERTSPSFNSISLRSELAGFLPNLSVVKERALCLPMANFLNNPFAAKLINAINSVQVVNMSAMQGLRNVTPEVFNDLSVKKYLEFLSSADPTLKDLSVSFTEKQVEKQRLDIGDFENRELVIQNIQVDVESIHNVYEGGEIVDSIKLPFLQFESSGTIKMLNILPAVFSALENGTPIIVDEIENGLHPNIVQKIVNLFNCEIANPLHAQLICTTHNISLANDGVRRDQVWVVDKNGVGKSVLTRVSDYPGTRNFDNIAQKYLKGAFGGIPNFS